MVQHNANAVLKTVSLTQLLPGCTAPIATKSTSFIRGGHREVHSGCSVVRKGARLIGDDNREGDGRRSFHEAVVVQEYFYRT